VVNLAVARSVTGHDGQSLTGGLAAIYGVFAAFGVLSVTHSAPFALALGVSRRSYYSGTALLVVSVAADYGLALLAVIAGASNGQGLGLHLLRVDYILPGPWYMTWSTSFIALALLFAYGMWVALVYRRWNRLGLFSFASAEATVVIVGVIAASRASAWPASSFVTTFSAAGLTGLVAAFAMILLAGGYLTMCRLGPDHQGDRVRDPARGRLRR
jgi:uncharacterized membrane protein YhaH (DUF805 family)